MVGILIENRTNPRRYVVATSIERKGRCGIRLLHAPVSRRALVPRTLSSVRFPEAGVSQDRKE